MPYKLPEIPPERRAEYTRMATDARKRYAQAKSDLKHGQRTLESVLHDPSLRRMRVLHVISSMPGVGRYGAYNIMDELGISYSRRVGGLGVRQTSALLERMR